MNYKSKMKKSNNRGLTLVEVIVAIAVLSVAILPLLYSFVYTTKFNVKSKEKQRATSAAQAIVEKYKAFPITDINSEFSSGSFDVGKQGINTTSTTFNMVAGTTDMKYVMKGVNFESNGTSENAKFDALITVSRHDPTDTKYVGAFFEIEGNNRMNDAVWRVSEEIDEQQYNTAINEVQAKWQALTDKGPGEPSVFVDIDLIKFKRELYFTISKSGNVYKISPQLKYTYSATKTYRDQYGNNKTFQVSPTVTGIDLSSYYSDGFVYNNTSTAGDGAKLKRFYIYYFPIYSITGTEIALEDKIEVNNNTGESINIFLYKQKKSSMTDAEITARENLAANSLRTKASFSGATVKLYQNLDTNIGTGYSNGIGMLLYDILDGDYDLEQMNSTSPSPVPSPTASAGITSVLEEGVMATATPAIIRSDILDDITVQIYRAGGIDGDGNVLNADALITEIKGSFNGKK